MITHYAPYHKRQQQFCKQLKTLGVSVFITTALPNIRYLTGFSGTSAMLALTEDSVSFLTDFRYKEQVITEITADTTIILTKSYQHHLKELKNIHAGTKVGFTASRVTYASLKQLEETFPTAEFIGLPDPFVSLRNIKDASEIENIQKAMDITENAFTHVLPLIKPGVREIEIAAELEYHMKLNGSDIPAFTTIVASGTRGALPHGIATEKKIENHELVTMDFGATYQGYCGDFTRTVAVGTVSDELQKAYSVVQKAQAASLEAIIPGMTGMQLDSVARNIINTAGYGKYFGHGLGHGVGLEIHEDIRISPNGSTKLATGMVHSVEPGIYLPSKGGIRIEDVVVITATGCRNLAKTPKDLLVL